MAPQHFSKKTTEALSHFTNQYDFDPAIVRRDQHHAKNIAETNNKVIKNRAAAG